MEIAFRANTIGLINDPLIEVPEKENPDSNTSVHVKIETIDGEKTTGYYSFEKRSWYIIRKNVSVHFDRNDLLNWEYID